MLAGKLAAEIVVDDALGEVRPSVYICGRYTGLYIPYSTSIPSTCELVYPKLGPTSYLTWLQYEAYTYSTSLHSNICPCPRPSP